MAYSQLVDNEAGILVDVPEDSVLEGIRTGRYSAPKGEKLYAYTQKGERYSFPVDKTADALRQGMRLESAAERQQRELEQSKEGLGGTAQAVALGAAKSMAVTGMEQTLIESGYTTAEDLEALKKTHPWATAMGEIVPLLASGGVGGVVRGAGTAAQKAATKGLGGLAGTAVGRVGAKTAGGAAEGAVMGIHQLAMDSEGQDPEWIAENALAYVGTATLAGGLVTGAFSGLGEMGRKALKPKLSKETLATLGEKAAPELTEEMLNRESFKAVVRPSKESFQALDEAGLVGELGALAKKPEILAAKPAKRVAVIEKIANEAEGAVLTNAKLLDDAVGKMHPPGAETLLSTEFRFRTKPMLKELDELLSTGEVKAVEGLVKKWAGEAPHMGLVEAAKKAAQFGHSLPNEVRHGYNRIFKSHFGNAVNKAAKGTGQGPVGSRVISSLDDATAHKELAQLVKGASKKGLDSNISPAELRKVVMGMAAGGALGGFGGAATALAGAAVRKAGATASSEMGAKALAQLSRMQTKEGIQQKIAGGIQTSVKNFLEGKKRSAVSRLGSASATSVLDKFVLEPRRKKPKSMGQKYNAILNDLARAVENPEKTVGIIKSNLRQLYDINPSAADMAVTKVSMGLSNAHRHAPKPVSERGLAPNHWQPSDSDVFDFAQYLAVLEDPFTALDMMNSGMLSRTAVKSLSENWPRFKEEVTQEIMQYMADNPGELDYNRIAQLSILLEQPLHPTMEPEFIRLMQQSYTTEKNLGGIKPGTRTSQLDQIKPSERMESRSEEIISGDY